MEDTIVAKHGDIYATQDEESNLSDSKELNHSDVSMEDSDDSSTDSEADQINSKDVLAVVPNTDNTEAPCNTLRMWLMGILLGMVVTGANAFFEFRFPTVLIGVTLVQLAAYPLGEIWYNTVPQWNIPLGFGYKIPLNPGPFSPKESICVYMFANVAATTKFSNDLLVQQKHFFELDLGGQYQIFWTLGMNIWGLGISGLFRWILVERPSMIWPETLSNAALTTSLYSKENKPANGWKISRYRFFLIALAAAFCWNWFPDLIFPALSVIGAWISWIRPNNATLSQVFGVQSGLGIFPLTFDWTQVGNLVSPMISPWWSTWNVGVSFVFWILIIMPALYYTNTWQTSYFPIMSNKIFDDKAVAYNTTRILNKDRQFELKGYEEYSKVFLPISYLMNYGLSLASITALFVTFALEYGSEVVRFFTSGGLRNGGQNVLSQDIHNKLIAAYKTCPNWWYAILALLGFVINITLNQVYDLQLPWYGLIVSMLIGVVILVPVGILESISTFRADYAVVMQLISGYWFTGKPIAVIQFMNYGKVATDKGLHFSNDMKLGHYYKVPPRVTFAVQVAGCVMASIVNVGVVDWVLGNIENICTLKAKNNMTCRYSTTQYNTNIVYGVLGPQRLFQEGGYSAILWFLLIGALLPFPVHLLKRYYPNISIIKTFSVPLFFCGASNIPSVTGINYTTWLVVGFIFNYWIHRWKTPWWRKYNFSLSVALDVGTDLAAILIYFTVVITGASDKINWWGTEVGGAGCDAKGCPHRVLEKGQVITR